MEGAKVRADLVPGAAGEGDVARYRSKSAPSSPAALPFRWRAARLRVGGGVRGGEERKDDDKSMRKECFDRSVSPSSGIWPKCGESGMLVVAVVSNNIAGA